MKTSKYAPVLIFLGLTAAMAFSPGGKSPFTPEDYEQAKSALMAIKNLAEAAQKALEIQDKDPQLFSAIARDPEIVAHIAALRRAA